MQVVFLQILLWILRIMLFLLLITIALIVIVMIVPIRYQVEGELHEKKPGVRGEITWFFYLINMKFSYENEFHIIVRILGFKVYDSKQEVFLNYEDELLVSSRKINLKDKTEGFKVKLQNVVAKIKEILKKIQDGKLKVEHYLELWNRKETQITFQRAKRKFGKVLKALLPKKWKLVGNVGFQDPATTGKLMGAVGAMYPILGNNVLIVPDFENEVIELEGNMKGHVRLANLTYQLISLLLNPYCFKFIKLVFDELGGSKKRKKET